MRLILFAVAALIFMTDQACKSLVRAKIPLGARVELFPDKLVLTHVRNRGAANGLFADNRKALMFFTAAAVLSEVYTFFDLRKHFRHHKAAWLAFAMNAGGGASNLLDRVAKKYTVDYLHFCPNKKSLVLNIADLFILTGVLGLIIFYVKQLILRDTANG